MKPEPYGTESTDFSTRRFLQRDVEVEFESTDKSGGFVGIQFTPTQPKVSRGSMHSLRLK